MSRAPLAFFTVMALAAGSPDVGLFAVDPRMSYVGKEVAAAAPDFWSPSVGAPAKKQHTRDERK